METVNTNNIARSADALVDKVAEKLHGGIREAQQGARHAGATISRKADGLGADAQHLLESVTDQAKDRINSVRDTARKTGESVTRSSEALISYAKQNPVKSLLLAAATGALLWSVLRAISTSRE